MQVSLYDNEKNVVTAGSVVRLTASHVVEAKSAWVEEFQRRRAQLVCDEDALVWTRGVMCDTAGIGDGPPRGYVILHAETIQGVVVFDDELQFSRTKPGTWALYVTYLATAPWNRRRGDRAGRFRYVGRNLVTEAVRESVRLGCPGRVGLHSYPDSSTFYDRLGFENLGIDASRRGMSYFELRPGAAYALLSGSGTSPAIGADRS
ncbi:MAG: hypothetical protein ACM3U2_18780 [Deltaproteobacteria bacterium]